MSATEAVLTLRRAEALLERLTEPEPETAELLEVVAENVELIETRWPTGRPEDVWERLSYTMARSRIADATSELRRRGVDLQTVRPALRLVDEVTS